MLIQSDRAAVELRLVQSVREFLDARTLDCQGRGSPVTDGRSNKNCSEVS